MSLKNDPSSEPLHMPNLKRQTRDLNLKLEDYMGGAEAGNRLKVSTLNTTPGTENPRPEPEIRNQKPQYQTRNAQKPNPERKIRDLSPKPDTESRK